MNLYTRILIVLCTLTACFSAWEARRRDNLATRNPAPAELYDVIQTQICSIRLQRYQEAYLQASRAYQATQGLEAFLEAARLDGQAIRQALRWEFACPEETEAGWEIPVLFYGRQGDLVRAVFSVVRERRTWKIDRMWVAARPEPARSGAGIRY
jgi:hypothetical protein